MNKQPRNKNKATLTAFILVYSLLLIVLLSSNSTITLSDNQSNTTNETNESINIDFDNDGFNSTVDCDDNNSQINQGITEILYNSLDDDCDSTTLDYLELNITTNKEGYAIGEQVTYTVHATNNSTVTITLQSPNNYYSYQASYLNQDYPLSDTITTTQKTGWYTLFGTIQKQGNQITYNKTFEIRNTLIADINGDTTLLENETLSLQANAIGGISPYTYRWNLGDGTQKTGSTITHKYDEGSRYEASLTITDAQTNTKTQAFTIRIRDLYKVKFLILDYHTHKPVTGALVTVGDTDATTKSNGIATLTIPEGEREVFIYKQGYQLLNQEHKINKEKTINLTLYKIDDQTPIITLEKNVIETTTDKTNITYQVEDRTSTDCTLYTSQDANWWIEKETTDNIDTEEKQIFYLYNLGEGETYYKIECVDSEQNTAFSAQATIRVNKQSKEKVTEHNQLILEIDEALDYSRNADLKTKEVYDALQIIEDQRATRKIIDSYDRDLYNIKNPVCPGMHCDDTKEETAQKILGLDQKISDAKKETLLYVDLIKDFEYIKYSKKEEISKVLEEYLEYDNQTLTQKQLGVLTEQNLLLQSKLEITSYAYQVDLTYLDGSTKQATIIIKELNANSTNTKQIILESIPKNVVERANQIIFFTENQEVIREDPLIRYDVSTKEIIYAVPRLVSLEEIQSTSTLLIDANAQKQKTPIGFLIFSLANKEDLKTTIIISIILLVIIIRVFFLFDLDKKLGVTNWFSFLKNKKKLHEVNTLINDSLDNLDANNFEKAALVYKEIRLTYEKLPLKVRKDVYEPIIKLVNILDEKYLEQLIIEQDKEHLKKIIPSLSADLRNKYSENIGKLGIQN
ncbi:PKD domain-containing protein [Candidatus Woesearchaeota archaeon]|nr:PKD domain-containing protein [Candidatus Woesearchaeota archaeon]